MARGEDPLCTYRDPHDVIDLPMEQDKFGSAVEFRQLWTRESSIRYSPIRIRGPDRLVRATRCRRGR